MARHQRGRLQGAMVEAVARHGYAGTTLRELVTLAGVSKSTFYQHFESKQDCFLSTFDEIVAQGQKAVAEAYREVDDFHAQMAAGLGAFVQLAAQQPAAASLVAIDSLSLGMPGVEHRERVSRSFELMIQQSLASRPSPHEVTPLEAKAIVGGISGIIYRRLRSGQVEELIDSVETIADWVVSYQAADSEFCRRACAAAGRQPAAPPKLDRPALLGWKEPPDSPLSRRTLTQRERILLAAAQVAVQDGYEALSIPAISATAGVSNQTFYEHFSGKRDAFLAAFELIVQDALKASVAAFEAEDEWPEALGAGTRALLEHIAGSETFSRLGFFELPVAGPAALDQGDRMVDSFTAYLTPELTPAELAPLPRTVLEAIGGGVSDVIQYEIAQGRRKELPLLGPQVARVILAPFKRAQDSDARDASMPM